MKLLHEVVLNMGMLCYFLAFCLILYAIYCKLAFSQKKKVEALDTFFPNDIVIVATRCRHRTALEAEVRGLGEFRTIKLNKNNEEEVEFCHACLEYMVIPCAWCSQPIFPFSNITLNPTKNHEGEIRKGAALLRYKLHEVAVGCNRPGCAKGEKDLIASWCPPGCVKFQDYPHVIFPKCFFHAALTLEEMTILI